MKYLISILLFTSVILLGQTVYRTPSGAKYHRSSCRMVKNVSSGLDVNEAVKIGLQPCKICNPPKTSVYGMVSSPKKVNGVNKGNQCLGRTKAGTRCKHYTRIGNDYCFQHVPKS
ncbi:hypothetical protein [Chryseobacterium carnipullorum]|uniref:hypothetical protein n=1 Tax=Chryseobacterium carnipullorum TaxID=1124835 RepID=UPI000E971F3C|nr:hypothetical protein [Chryseobacterium carnipullorum]MDN5478662.1 hypothetical protein [Chryseobacterium sp.]HBV16783.1 hypothetical protein [Chryseobacterium carnipullorum]